MDPVTAISLASAIVQFVDFSSKVVTKTIEIYRDQSTVDQSRADLDTILVTRNLILVTRQLRLDDQIVTASTEYEAALLELRERCERLGNELIVIFERVSRAPAGRWLGLWRSLRRAIRRVWNEEKIREIQARLASIREQMNLHITTEVATNVQDLPIRLAENRDHIIGHITIGIDSITTLMKSTKRYWIGGFLVLSLALAMQSYLSVLERAEKQHRESKERRDSIANWLTTLDFRQKQKDTLASRYPDTGNWLLNSSDFNDWLFGSDPTLWLNGIPGSGKTVLTDGTYPSLDSLYHLVQLEVGRKRPAFIVIDALDECLETAAARAKLIRMVGELAPSAKLLLTSRPHVNVSHHIPWVRRVDVLASDDDVGRYVQGRISDIDTEFGRVIQGNEALQTSIVTAVVAKAKGMFLLARFHMDSLAHKSDVREVRRALKDLPTRLSDAYKSAMERIENEEEDVRLLARKVLYWISYAVRPLFLTELRHALAVEPWEPRLDEEGLKNPDYLISVCAGLVVTEQQTGIIRLVHYSAEEYFRGLRENLFPEAQRQIASVCLTYISYDAHAKYNCSVKEDISTNKDLKCIKEDTDDIISKSPFYEYAARYWGIHASGEPEARINNMILKFLDSDPYFFCSVQSKIISDYTWPRARYHVLKKPVPKLWVVAGFGLTGTSRTLIERGADLDATAHYASRRWEGPTALQEASFNGHVETVQLLLESGANPNFRSGPNSSPLIAAAFNGHTQILRLLLDKGAHLEASDLNYGTAVGAASLNGHDEAVQLLLYRGANANAKTNSQVGSPLKAASINGHEGVAKLLLKLGAPVDEGVSFDGSWILRLQELGDEERLLKYREEVYEIIRRRISYQNPYEGERGDCENALHCACFFGHYRVAHLLLENGARLDHQGGLWGTALQAASFRGFREIVELLVEKGADVNAKGLLLGNALEAASIYGHEHVVRLLLDKGADITSRSGGLFGCALQTASSRGHTHVVRLLLEKRGTTFRVVFSACNWLFSRPILRSTKAGNWCFVL